MRVVPTLGTRSLSANASNLCSFAESFFLIKGMLLNDTYWSKIEEKVKETISDIVPYSESKVPISRVERNSSFNNETLRILIEING